MEGEGVAGVGRGRLRAAQDDTGGASPARGVRPGGPTTPLLNLPQVGAVAFAGVNHVKALPAGTHAARTPAGPRTGLEEEWQDISAWETRRLHMPD